MRIHRPGALFRHWAIWLGGGLALGLLLAGIWAWLLEPAVNAARAAELVIPLGTAEAVAAGQPAPFIPNALSLSSNRELRVRNDDVATHTVAGFSIPPGGTATIRPEPATKTVVCTVHPSGYLGVTIEGRPGVGWVLAIALLAGVPFGALFGGIAFLMQRLGTGDGGATPAPA